MRILKNKFYDLCFFINSGLNKDINVNQNINMLEKF